MADHPSHLRAGRCLYGLTLGAVLVGWLLGRVPTGLAVVPGLTAGAGWLVFTLER